MQVHVCPKAVLPNLCAAGAVEVCRSRISEVKRFE